MSDPTWATRRDGRYNGRSVVAMQISYANYYIRNCRRKEGEINCSDTALVISYLIRSSLLSRDALGVKTGATTEIGVLIYCRRQSRNYQLGKASRQISLCGNFFNWRICPSLSLSLSLSLCVFCRLYDIIISLIHNNAMSLFISSL